MLNLEPAAALPSRRPDRHGPDEDELGAVIAAAIRAPSADNSQPWQVDIDDGRTLAVSLDERRGHSDGIGPLAALVSLGGLLESIALESERRGYRARVAGQARSFRVSFDTDGGGRTTDAPLLAAALAKRATDRAAYERAPLPARTLAAFQADGGDAASIRVSSARDAVARVARAHALAERVRFEAVDPAALHRWLRFDARAAARTKDGLDARLLALRGHERLFLRASGVPAFASCARALGAGRLAAARAEREVLASGAVGVIVQRGTGEQAFVDTGRAMMRVWLRATCLGLSFAPVMASALLPLGRRLGYLARHDRDELLDEAERTLRDTFGVRRGWHVSFVFRVGVPTCVPTIASERRDVASFTARSQEVSR